jgi:hypothetical protein
VYCAALALAKGGFSNPYVSHREFIYMYMARMTRIDIESRPKPSILHASVKEPFTDPLTEAVKLW